MLTIRAACPQDINTIAHIHEVCWRDAYNFMPDEVLNKRDKNFRARQWQNWFNENKMDADEGLFVFEQENKTIGFCMCKPNQDDTLIGARGEIHALYVLPEARTFGVSYLAAYTLSKYLVERDLSPICCWAFQKNKIWRWYERLGFKKMIARNRRINNVDIPEYGMVHFEPSKLIDFSHQQLQRTA
ncbi:GNAT family N-acetyltransferase [Terasakiella sp. A23]|uniref:GNAT family N-acetyltransferase n=1 Tax=Terasakiella sp. FCG-A23 TaxID=3080561 RepID=UPI002954D0EE|nr:GNAT family N-acetyltransferase [Terasakiella sp. A23]MDV7340456.1 GNAT family N-acetyltransferase [Terasakiella sp. A23]